MRILKAAFLYFAIVFGVGLCSGQSVPCGLFPELGLAPPNCWNSQSCSL
jgi:hypothetical protein